MTLYNYVLRSLLAYQFSIIYHSNNQGPQSSSPNSLIGSVAADHYHSLYARFSINLPFIGIWRMAICGRKCEY